MIDELYNGVKERSARARTLAVSLGKMIGRVSKFMPNKIDQENLNVNVVVDAETYYNNEYLGRMGILLGAVDIRTLQFILLQVTGYERSDITSSLFNASDLTPKLADNEDPGTLIGNVILKCEMLTRLDPLGRGEPVPADIIPEPQSPVIIPFPEMIERSMGINRGKLKLGFLDISNSEAKVSIPPDELNFHALIIGTTGAGKTSFVKDIIASLLTATDDEQILVFDATGDYYHSFLPPDITSSQVKKGVEEFSKLIGPINGIEMDILFPLTAKWLNKFAKERTEEDITKAYFKLYLDPLINYLKRQDVKVEVSIEGRTIELQSGNWKSRANVNPFYISFKENRRAIHKLNPYFSEQASHFLKIFSSNTKDIDSLDEFIDSLSEENFEKLQVHKSTRENILRGLYLLKETGLFDIRAPRTSFKDILKSKFIVIDLYNQDLDDFSQKILVYHLLDRIFQIREIKMRNGEINNKQLLVIDEAHRFFPSNRGGEEDSNYLRRVASKISIMMRLGRRRRIGFMFSTHNPSDLSDIIVQLANTKFVFRTSLDISESLGISRSEGKILSWERNGVAYMISPWLKQGKLKLRVPVPPPLGHYDLSRT
ncbi:MAG: ATP-binding protein [Metallosphaera sp.]